MNVLKELLSAVFNGLRIPKVKRFLIVEDDRSDAELIAWDVSAVGGIPHVVHSASGAFEALRVQKFDFILLDFRLPDMDGYATFERAKAMYPRMRAVFVLGEPADLTVVKPGAYIIVIRKSNSIAQGLRELLNETEPMSDRRTAVATLVMWLVTAAVGYLAAKPSLLIELIKHLK